MGRPYVVVKAGLSLDGKIACEDSTSQWITGPEARQDAHQRIRATSQAILVGSKTALKDRPRLNVRDATGATLATPLRVVLDSRGRVTEGPLMDTAIGPTLIFTSHLAPEQSHRAWREAGVEAVVVDLNNKAEVKEAVRESEGLDLGQVLAELGRRGVLQVLVEGGGKLQGSFVEADLVDRVVLYYGACFLGAGGLAWAQRPYSMADTISKVKFWNLEKVRQLGNDVCLEYARPPPPQ